MSQRVAIVGVGFTAFRPLSPEASFRELIFEAAVRAYTDAGIEPGQVDTFVSVSEDYLEGTAIADEYVPDQLGAVLKPVHTITADGITALGSVFLQLQTGEFDIAVVEGRSKASNILYPAHVEAMALDPVNVRPLNLHPRFVAGLDMRAFLEHSGNTEEQTAAVVVKNRENAQLNPMAAYGVSMSVGDIMTSKVVADPLRVEQSSRTADGSIVMVLATEEAAEKMHGRPVFIKGIGWGQETPNLDERDWGRAGYAVDAARRAYKMAEIDDPAREIQIAEVDDTFAYKELQHLEALGLAAFGRSGAMLEEGAFDCGGNLPVNVSGGNLGCGYTHDLSGLRSVLELVLQLRGRAGQRQLESVSVGLAQSWRGIPTASGGVAILEVAR